MVLEGELMRDPHIEFRLFRHLRDSLAIEDREDYSLQDRIYVPPRLRYCQDDEPFIP